MVRLLRPLNGVLVTSASAVLLLSLYGFFHGACDLRVDLAWISSAVSTALAGAPSRRAGFFDCALRASAARGTSVGADVCSVRLLSGVGVLCVAYVPLLLASCYRYIVCQNDCAVCLSSRKRRSPGPASDGWRPRNSDKVGFISPCDSFPPHAAAAAGGYPATSSLLAAVVGGESGYPTSTLVSPIPKRVAAALLFATASLAGTFRKGDGEVVGENSPSAR